MEGRNAAGHAGCNPKLADPAPTTYDLEPATDVLPLVCDRQYYYFILFDDVQESVREPNKRLAVNIDSQVSCAKRICLQKSDRCPDFGGEPITKAWGGQVIKRPTDQGSAAWPRDAMMAQLGGQEASGPRRLQPGISRRFASDSVNRDTRILRYP
ncbi:MAG TPA: hypothetical protein VEK57_24295 [Thermoanaerobaculia bacterium]|nr:hypothetical protein [Thermoanaerobaculia bacterium]